ncbi:transposase family protein [Mesorhizobium sp. USDA-HM6]|nr:transposase family protein [Mesorhizobium sp. USDA-HM6]
MSLAQVVAQEGGEVQAAIAALELLSLKGLTITADALHCHRRMTKTVREGCGHYAIAIKGNQSKLASDLLATVRRHWSIENELHWQLDVLLGEDQIRGRKNNTAANHAILRRLTLNVLRADPENIPLSH